MAFMSNGCICCSVRNDLVVTVDELLREQLQSGRPPLQRIVLETSGLSRPGPILRALSGLGASGLRTQVVATYDCQRGAANAGFDEAVAQWAGAHRIVLTKLDLVESGVVHRAQQFLNETNPLADIVIEQDRSGAAAKAFSPLRRSKGFDPRSLYGWRSHIDIQHPRTNVMLATFAGAAMWDDVAEWLDNLAAVCGEGLLRLKGLVNIQGVPHPVLVQSVGTTFSPPSVLSSQPSKDHSFLVVITRDIETAVLRTVPTPLSLSFSERRGSELNRQSMKAGFPHGALG
jgi:G3E family GTPase